MTEVCINISESAPNWGDVSKRERSLLDRAYLAEAHQALRFSFPDMDFTHILWTGMDGPMRLSGADTDTLDGMRQDIRDILNEVYDTLCSEELR